MADRVLLVGRQTRRCGVNSGLRSTEAGYIRPGSLFGEEAIRKLETEPCDVVVTDIRLGDLSGRRHPQEGQGGQIRNRGDS